MTAAGGDGAAQKDAELRWLRDENTALRNEIARLGADDARAAVAASERRLREVLESIDEAFVLVGDDGRILDLNHRVTELDGRSPAQLVGRDYFAVWPGPRNEDLAAVFRRVRERQEPTRLRHSYGAGERRPWYEARIFPSGQGVAVFYRDVTEQRAAERRLAEAEAGAAMALVAAQLGSWSFNPQTGALAWDERCRAMFGVAPDAAIDFTTFSAALHEADRQGTLDAVAAAIDPQGGGRYSVEYRVRTLDAGLVRWVSAFGRSQFEAGRCVRLTGVVQDITERKRAEEERRESDARFRAIAEATPFLVFVADLRGHNTYTNPQFTAFTGLSPAELLGHGWLDVVHPEDRPRAASTWEAALRDGGVYQIEQRFRRHDGAYRWFLCRGIPVRVAAEDGTAAPVAQWFGSCADIEDMMRAREVLARDRDGLERLVAERTAALRTSLARLRALFDHSTECLFLLRVEPGRGPTFLDVNPPGLAVLGRSLAEVVGRAPRELLSDEAAADQIEQVLASALRPGAGPHRYMARRRYGQFEHELDAIAVALPGAAEEQLILITARDVSQQRVLEEALRQSHKMEAVGQLTGGIAHDFNNLLTGIGGSIELMQTRVAQGRLDGLERYAEAAAGAVRRAGALTHRLLAFARRQALDPRPTDLNRIVAGLEEMVQRTVGPAIVLRTVLDPAVWPTLCDPSQLESALLNLCINARDAMPQGGELAITTTNLEVGETEAARLDVAAGAYVAITVSDSGSGMTPEVMARAFEPFFTTKPLGQGTGLGLSMLYGFVRQSGGHVRIESQPGRGTAVHLALPRHSGPEPAAEGAAALAPGGAAGAGRKVVLVVEDEDVVRMLVAEVVQGMGWVALQTADAPAALQVLRSDDPIDLLLTDIGLPGMSGRELAQAARVERPGLPVLFITGYAHDALPGNAMLEPGTELLTKPFPLEVLADRLGTMLAG